jgi:hypothetical protein
MIILFQKGGDKMKRNCRNCNRGYGVAKNKKAPIAAVTFGGALLCFCCVSRTVLVVTVGVSCIALGIYLLKNN